MTDLGLLFLFLLGSLLVTNILIVWKNTSFPLHMYNLWFPNQKVDTYKQWVFRMLLQFGWFGELLTCSLCFATHVSWIIGLVLCLLFSTPFAFILLGMCTWPTIAYTAELLLQILERKANHTIDIPVKEKDTTYYEQRAP